VQAQLPLEVAEASMEDSREAVATQQQIEQVRRGA
jgi:hypothetical protein